MNSYTPGIAVGAILYLSLSLCEYYNTKAQQHSLVNFDAAQHFRFEYETLTKHLPDRIEWSGNLSPPKCSYIFQINGAVLLHWIGIATATDDKWTTTLNLNRPNAHSSKMHARPLYQLYICFNAAHAIRRLKPIVNY